LGLFPTLVVRNKYYIGDNVIIEPLASKLALSHSTYLISKWPEMYMGHPNVVGVSNIDSISKDARYVDIGDSLSNMENKKDAIWASINANSVEGQSPRLYLTAGEIVKVKSFRQYFDSDKKCIGIVTKSRHNIKNWKHIYILSKKLRDEGYSVFIFSDSFTDSERKKCGSGYYEFINKPLREVMLNLAMMDVVVGTDTGIVHIAAALGVPTVVLLYPSFTDLWEDYENCSLIYGDISYLEGIRNWIRDKTHILDETQQWYSIFGSIKYQVLKRIDRLFETYIASGIIGLSIREVCNTVVDSLEQHKPRLNISSEETNISKFTKHLFVRFRGIGDVLLSLPAIATIKSCDKNTKITYVTSPQIAKLIEYSSVIDEVIPFTYAHATSGYPRLPSEIDISEYDTIHNLINRIDFESNSDSVMRTDLFGQCIGLEKINYDSNWKLKIPKIWNDEAEQILEQCGVTPTDKVIALQVDSDGVSRRWPIVRLKEFVGLAIRKHYKVVMLSKNPYRDLHKHVINLTNKSSVEQFVGLLAVCDVFVGPDSSGIHIAGCIGKKPAIGLFGSIDPQLRIAHYDNVSAIVGKRRCVPCNDWQKTTCKNNPKCPVCLWNIKANEVLKKVEEVI